MRTWTGPGGQTLTAVATVWDSHLVATQVGADLAQRLVSDGRRGWTPPGARPAPNGTLSNIGRAIPCDPRTAVLET